MAKTNQINVKVNDPTNRAIEAFAEDRDYTKAEAVRRIAESRLRSEGYLSKQIYGDGEPEPVADGGQIFRPFLRELGAIFGVMGLILVSLLPVDAVFDIPMVGFVRLLSISLAVLINMAFVLIIQATDYPERADQHLYSAKNRTVGTIRGVRSKLNGI